MSQLEENKQSKPRVFKTAMNVEFVLSGGALAVFKELLKTYEDAINEDELPMELGSDYLLIRGMDSARVKMANFNISRKMFDEWHVGNKTNYKAAPLPIRILVPIGEVLYAIETAGKDAKARFEISTVFHTRGVWNQVTLRKPEKCPKCGLPTIINNYPMEKRKIKVTKRSKSELYKCSCGWRGRVKTFWKKERAYSTTASDESAMKIEVVERAKETYKVTILQDAPETMPLPQIYFKAHYKLVAKDFKAILERMRKRTENFKMKGSERDLVLSAKGDLIEMNIKVDKNSGILLDADCNSDEETATYSLEHVLPLLPKPSITEVIGLKYSTDMPLEITWMLGADCLVDFYVAPIKYEQ